MADAYEAWQETRRRLAGGYPAGTTLTPEAAEYLQQIEESLRPAALTAYLASFRGLDIYEEPLECTPEQAEKFLADLDELRQPQYKPDETREQMRFEIGKALDAMKRLNWTGDHTYGDALSDAGQVLHSVLSGKGFPKLERFRCPSEYGSKARQNERVRCELQLPHESKHQARNTAGGEDFTWTDEPFAQTRQAPAPYDEPKVAEPSKRCRSIEPAGGVLQCEYVPHLTPEHVNGDVSWSTGRKQENPDPINRPLVVDHPVRSDDGVCGALNTGPSKRPNSVCVRVKGHRGLHHDEDEMRWRQ